ncbi:MAG TPA: hypothetical protein VGJ94_17615 [Syntrophorhabdaceae bacterium]|jgi:hypothetical protein
MSVGQRLFTLLILLGVQLCFLCIPTLLTAAPAPVAGPIDIEGTIVEATWIPETKIKAIPHMTGSAGVDRVMPARFRVTLAGYSGLTVDALENMWSFYGWSIPRDFNGEGMPAMIVLHLAHPDKTFLKKGMRILVKGYRIFGDEGGDYPSYKELHILSRTPIAD